MIGNFSGMVVHQVGNQSSCDRRKLMCARDFDSVLCGGRKSSQKRCWKRSVTLIALPIASLLSAACFCGGRSGKKRTVPGSSGDACNIESGRVISNRGAVIVIVPEWLWDESLTFPGFHRIAVATVSGWKVTFA